VTSHRQTLLPFGILCLLACPGTYGQPPVSAETAVKAAFLFNFAKFVEWPASSSGPLAFCVIGDDSMATQLEASVAGKSIGARPVVVRNRLKLEELSSCSVIYIGRGNKNAAVQAAQLVAGKQILTVSEFPELGSQGVTINFYLDDESVRFEVHLGAVKQAGLKISSKLLSLARVTGR
jgi:hypothetical protein